MRRGTYIQQKLVILNKLELKVKLWLDFLIVSDISFILVSFIYRRKLKLATDVH